MKYICLSCAEEVDNHGINPNYHGMMIHYGQDWYCGPVIKLEESIFQETLKFLKHDKNEKDWLQTFFDENFTLMEELDGK